MTILSMMITTGYSASNFEMNDVRRAMAEMSVDREKLSAGVCVSACPVARPQQIRKKSGVCVVFTLVLSV